MEKRIMAVVFCTLMLFASVPMVAGATEDTITVTVTIQLLSVELRNVGDSADYTTWALGTVVLSSNSGMATGDGIFVKNTGNVAENFKLKLTNPASWTASTSAGADTYVLRAEFQATGAAPTYDGTETALTTTYQTCNGTLFKGTGDGNNVAASSGEYLYLRFEAPTSTSSYTEQTITLTVGCEAYS